MELAGRPRGPTSRGRRDPARPWARTTGCGGHWRAAGCRDGEHQQSVVFDDPVEFVDQEADVEELPVEGTDGDASSKLSSSNGSIGDSGAVTAYSSTSSPRHSVAYSDAPSEKSTRVSLRLPAPP